MNIAYYEDYAYCKQLLWGMVKYDIKIWSQDVDRVLYGHMGIIRKLAF